MADSKNEKQNEALSKASEFRRRDVLSIQDIKDNPISIILIKKFTINGKLDSKALVASLHKFSESKAIDDKLFFLFNVYDGDGDGHISNQELFDILKLLNKGILEDSKIQNIVNRTFSEVGEYLNEINYEQFKKLILDRCVHIKSMFGCDK